MFSFVQLIYLASVSIYIVVDKVFKNGFLTDLNVLDYFRICIMLFISFLALLFGNYFLYLLIYHLYIISKNVSTYEFIKREVSKHPSNPYS